MRLAGARIVPASVGVVLGASALLACTALIGTPDLFFVTSDAASSGGRSGGDGSSGSLIDGASSGGPDATTTTCDGVDLTSDAKHCGACSHDCLGGACVGSKCQPVELAVAVGQPYAIGVDDTSVYFS